MSKIERWQFLHDMWLRHCHTTPDHAEPLEEVMARDHTPREIRRAATFYVATMRDRIECVSPGCYWSDRLA